MRHHKLPALVMVTWRANHCSGHSRRRWQMDPRSRPFLDARNKMISDTWRAKLLARRRRKEEEK